MSITSCPQCGKQVTIPAGVDTSVKVRCPLCHSQYTLADALVNMPPHLELVDETLDIAPAEPDSESTDDANLAAAMPTSVEPVADELPGLADLDEPTSEDDVLPPLDLESSSDEEEFEDLTVEEKDTDVEIPGEGPVVQEVEAEADPLDLADSVEDAALDFEDAISGEAATEDELIEPPASEATIEFAAEASPDDETIQFEDELAPVSAEDGEELSFDVEDPLTAGNGGSALDSAEEGVLEASAGDDELGIDFGEADDAQAEVVAVTPVEIPAEDAADEVTDEDDPKAKKRKKKEKKQKKPKPAKSADGKSRRPLSTVLSILLGAVVALPLTLYGMLWIGPDYDFLGLGKILPSAMVPSSSKQSTYVAAKPTIDLSQLAPQQPEDDTGDATLPADDPTATDDDPAAEPPSDAPTIEPDDAPAADDPADETMPAEESAPTDESLSPPLDESAEMPADAPDLPGEDAGEPGLAAEPAPSDDPLADLPADDPADPPSDAPVDMPADAPADAPGEDLFAPDAAMPADEPAADPLADEPAAEPTDDPFAPDAAPAPAEMPEDQSPLEQPADPLADPAADPFAPGDAPELPSEEMPEEPTSPPVADPLTDPLPDAPNEIPESPAVPPDSPPADTETPATDDDPFGGATPEPEMPSEPNELPSPLDSPAPDNELPAPSEPSLGPVNAATVTPDTLAQAVQTARTADQQIVAGRDTASENEYKRLRSNLYLSFFRLADAATFAEDESGSGQLDATRQQLEQFVREFAADAERVHALKFNAGRWLDFPRRTTHGVMLPGTVHSTQAVGQLHAVTLNIGLNAAAQQGPTVVVLSDKDPGLSEGDEAIVLGRIIDDPGTQLAGYEGTEAKVVWNGMLLKLTPRQ